MEGEQMLEPLGNSEHGFSRNKDPARSINR